MAFCMSTLVLWRGADVALSQPPERPGRWTQRSQGEHWQRPPGRRGPARRPGMRSLDRTIDTGHLFLDGEYMRPPFRVTFRNEQLLVNDVPIPIPPVADVSGDDTADRIDEGNGAVRRRRRPLVPRSARSVVQALESDLAVVVLPGQVPQTVDPFLLFKLLLAEDRSEHLDDLLAMVPESTDRQVLREWLVNYSVPPELEEFAAGWMDRVEQVEAGNMASIHAVQRFYQLAYPLSVFGMLLGAISVGHLLSWRPSIAGSRQETDASPLAQRMLSRSILLIVLLSLFDLVWTILASQAGQMKELNPLASRFVDDPVGLILFKAVATCVGVGLLLALRHHRRAQVATWWLCLVCTLLAFRWLTFGSMYVT